MDMVYKTSFSIPFLLYVDHIQGCNSCGGYYSKAEGAFMVEATAPTFGCNWFMSLASDKGRVKIIILKKDLEFSRSLADPSLPQLRSGIPIFGGDNPLQNCVDQKCSHNNKLIILRKFEIGRNGKYICPG